MVFQVASPLGAITYAGTTFGQTLAGSAARRRGAARSAAQAVQQGPVEHRRGQVGRAWSARPRRPAQAVAADVGWQYKVSFVLLLIASLNIFVGVFNLLPLLPMDGGHVAAIIWERVRAWFARLRGRPDPGLVDMAKLLPVSFSLFVVLVFFSVAGGPGRHRQPGELHQRLNRPDG